MQKLLGGIAHLVTERRAVVWVMIAGITAVSVAGWSGVKLLDRERPRWLSIEERQLEREKGFEFHGFPCVVVVQADNLFAKENVERLHELSRKLEELETVDSVLWFGDLPSSGVLLKTVLPDREPLPPPEEIRRRCREHSLIADQLLGKDGNTLLIPVIPKREHWRDQDGIRETAQGVLADTGMTAHVTGRASIYLAHREAFGEENLRIQALALGCIVLLALLIFRGVSPIVIVVSGPVLGAVWSLGLLQLFGEPRNQLTDVILPVLVLMIGFTDGVHLITRLRELRAGGADSQDAARRAVREVGTACLLTSVTTAIGFCSLMISDSEVVQAFGRSCAIGVLLTFVTVVMAIPLLAQTRLGRRIHENQERDLIHSNMHRLSGLIRFIIRQAKPVAIAGVMLTMFLGNLTLTLRPDDRLAHRTPHDSDAYRGLIVCDEQFGGVRYVQIIVDWPEEASPSQKWQLLNDCEAVFDEEESLKGTLSIRTWLALAPGDDSSFKFAWLPLIPEKIRTEFWKPDRRQALIAARITDQGIASYAPVFERVKAKLIDVESRHGGVALRLAGEPIVEGRVVKEVVVELIHSLMVAAGVIFVVLTASFRSIRLGLISVLPNIFPLAAAGAIRALWEPSLDIASACAFTVCLGIAVDDTIHFLARYRYERERHADADIAIERTMLSVGSALVMTTIVLVAGFGIVMTAGLPTHSLFAGMAIATIGAALIGDVLMLPALLKVFVAESRERSDESPEPKTARDVLKTDPSAMSSAVPSD